MEFLTTDPRDLSPTGLLPVPGSFSLFGAAALAKRAMGLRDGERVGFLQQVVASAQAFPSPEGVVPHP